jgi:hypothetical protein
MIPEALNGFPSAMKTRTASKAFDDISRIKTRLAGFLPEVQAQAAAILADPSKASSWGRKVERDVRAANRKVQRCVDNEPVLIDAAARALEDVATALQCAPAGSLDADACAELGRSLDALAVAARPLKEAHRDILSCQHDIPGFRTRMDEHIKAAALLPPSQALHDRVCFLEGLRQGLDGFRRSLDDSSAVSNIKRCVGLLRASTSGLPKEYRAKLEKIREIEIISEGLQSAISVHRPLAFRR